MSRFINLEFNNEFEDQSGSQSVVKDGKYYFTAAQAAFAEMQFEQSLRYYSKVLEFNPGNVAAWTGQVRALIELGEFREAKLWADKALEKFPSEPELLAAKAVALGRTGDLQGALAFSDASIEERGDTYYIWLARGDVLLAREEKRADYCFDKALTLAPKDWLVAWLSARIRFYYKKFSLALRSAQQALEWDPARAVLWLQVGLCQKELGLIALARTSLEQARQLNPRCEGTDRALLEISEAGLLSRVRGWWLQVFGR